MKIAISLLCFMLAWPLRAELKQVPDEAPQAVFAGAEQQIKVTFRNETAQLYKTAARLRLYQAGNSIIMPVGKVREWKMLQVLPGQQVTESAALALPSIPTGTLFQVFWLDQNDKVIGLSNVYGYPENLLQQIQTLVGRKPLGIFDPTNRLKPLLKLHQIEFADFSTEDSLQNFTGPLAVFGPFDSAPQLSEPMLKALETRIKSGMSIIWLQPEEAAAQPGPPLAIVSRLGTGVVVVASTSAVARLNESAAAQRHLIRLAELALKPEPPPFLPKSP